MTDVAIKCDRCGEEIHGMREPGMTAGFYDVTDQPWSKYARTGEAVVCDRCMWSDPGYQADYGLAAGVPITYRKLPVLGCARCGQDHKEVVWRRFQGRSIEDSDGTIWNWWGICPATGDPILQRDVPESDTAPEGKA